MIDPDGVISFYRNERFGPGTCPHCERPFDLRRGRSPNRAWCRVCEADRVRRLYHHNGYSEQKATRYRERKEKQRP